MSSYQIQLDNCSFQKRNGRQTHTLTHILMYPSTKTHTCHMAAASAAADGSLIVPSAAVMKLEMLLTPPNRIHTDGIDQL